MDFALQLVAFAAEAYLIVLLGRIVFEWIQMFTRSWRPQGPVLVLANLVYGLTDPPLRWLRQWVKPVQIGAISLDLAFLLLFFLVWFIQNAALQLAHGLIN